jgi:hypothetical protein
MNRVSIGVLLALVAGASTGQVVAPDFTASPDVYKVRAENDQYRVVEGVWKPSQRDAFHSHPAMLYYWVTPCSLRAHLPDGATRDFSVVAGQAGSQAPIASHALENVSTSACKIVMFESK